MKDFYQVLGVARDAAPDEIKQAFRRLARKHHPDVSREADATARMAEVNEAYAVLSDPGRRAAYDDALRRGRGRGSSGTRDRDTGFEFSSRGFGYKDLADIFDEIFGPGMTRGSRPYAGGEYDLRGDDLHAQVEVSLEDAFRGATRPMTLRSPRMNERGEVTLEERTLEVKIPPGIRSGQRIRVAGQGSAGSGGAPAGDLLLQVTILPHPRFTVEGGDLFAELPVAPWEAALGAVVPLTMPDGSALRVRVPAGAQGGRKLSVRGRGMPGKPPGDLHLRVRVVLPAASDAAARDCYEKMAELFPDFDARRAAEADGG